MKWSEFVPAEVEYDFDKDKLHAHGVELDEAIECFGNPYSIRRNKDFPDRFKLLGKSDAGRSLCIIFQLKMGNIVRIITGWEI